MPKKRSKRKNPPRSRTVAQAKGRSRRRRRARRNPAGALASKGAATEVAVQIGTAFAGYAGTRLLSRAIATGVSKKSPKLAKHAGMIGSLTSFGAAFFVLPAWKKTQDYADSALIGSGVAVLQNLIRTYLPKYGWIVGDYHQDIGAETPALTEPRGSAEDIEELPEEWRPELQSTGRVALPGTNGKSDDDLSDILEADLGSLGYDGDSADMALAEYGA